MFVRFPEEETGKKRKLSRPWYGPFRVISRHDPNLTVQKVYFHEDSPLTVHQLQACLSPDMLPAGFYWYGAKRRSEGRTPTWLQRMLNAATTTDDTENLHNSVSTSQGLTGVSDGETHEDDLEFIVSDHRQRFRDPEEFLSIAVSCARSHDNCASFYLPLLVEGPITSTAAAASNAVQDKLVERRK